MFQSASTKAFFTSEIGALVLSLSLLIASSCPEAAANALSCNGSCILHALASCTVRSRRWAPAGRCMGGTVAPESAASRWTRM